MPLDTITIAPPSRTRVATASVTASVPSRLTAIVSRATRASKPRIAIAALSTSTSMSSSSARAAMLAGSPMSSCRTLAPSIVVAAASRPRARSRHARITRHSRAASCRAVSSPSPRFAPVISAVFTPESVARGSRVTTVTARAAISPPARNPFGEITMKKISKKLSVSIETVRSLAQLQQVSGAQLPESRASQCFCQSDRAGCSNWCGGSVLC
jgi:hypothetical protein